jgi:hypothetical protein
MDDRILVLLPRKILNNDQGSKGLKAQFTRNEWSHGHRLIGIKIGNTIMAPKSNRLFKLKIMDQIDIMFKCAVYDLSLLFCVVCDLW